MARSLEELRQTEIGEILNRKISIFTPDDSISKVLGELEKFDRYESVVYSGSKMGIVSIRDILNVEQPANMKVVKIWKASTPFTSDSWIGGVATELVRLNLRAFPVVELMKPAGIISQVDIVNSLAECSELKNINPVSLAKMAPVTVETDSKISQARSIMLEKGFSHLPVTKNGKLAGIVTAKDLVLTFITKPVRVSVGERIGEPLERFSGEVSGIMDRTPLTVGKNGSAFDVALGMRDRKKSACLLVENDVVLGIITPREMLKLIGAPLEEPELPIQIIGLTDEDFFERSVAEEKVRRIISKNIKFHPDINEVSIIIKKQSPAGERVRYDMTARVLSPIQQHQVTASGWDLLWVFDNLTDELDKVLRKAKREPSKTQRRGRGRTQSS